MKSKYILLGAFAVLAVVSNAQADTITLSFSGSIKYVEDFNALGPPTINFPPIPPGSLFSGTYTYNSNAPETGSSTGLALYDNLAPASGSVTVNGFNFATTLSGNTNTGLDVISSEYPYPVRTGVFMSTQPITLPGGWSVAYNSFPYFTLQFEDLRPQSRPLTLPVATGDFPTGFDQFVLDFQQPVTVGSTTYGERVGALGDITSFSVSSSSAVPEPSTFALGMIALACLAVWRRSKRSA